MSVNDYKNESVSYAGRKWEERFCSLIQRLPVHVLSRSSDKGNNKHIWEKTNSWMLNIALGNNSQNATLIALWDGKGGDGKGGTEHMVHIAKKMDVNVEIMDINRIG